MMNNHAHDTEYDRIWTEVYGDIQQFGPVHRHMRRILSRMLRSIQYNSVLDVGCGLGHNFTLFTEKRYGLPVAGIDISRWAIEHVKQNWGEDFHELDIQQKHLDRCWDLVFSSLLLEHIQDDLAALGNMRAMTGRYLLVTTMAGDFERYKAWDSQMGHVRNYHVGELEAKLEKTGFTVQRVVYWGFPFYSPFARTLQNTMKAGSEFGIKTRLIADIMYYLYFFNSHKRGDLLIILASV